jgi:hypothetical protein
MVIVAVFIVGWAIVSLDYWRFNRGLIPAKFEIGWFYAEGACDKYLFDYNVAFAVNLEQETLDLIERQGLQFFSDADVPDRPERHGPFFRNWKKTPLKVKAMYEELNDLYVLGCGERYSWFWPDGIEAELARSGSYYAIDGLQKVFVLPRLRLVVMTFQT